MVVEIVCFVVGCAAGFVAGKRMGAMKAKAAAAVVAAGAKVAGEVKADAAKAAEEVKK